MAEDFLASNSDNEIDSDQFSDDLFDAPSESDGAFCSEFTTGAVDYVAESPDPVRSASRGQQSARRLFPPDDERETHRGELLENATATEPDTQKLILEELRKTNSRLESFSDRLEALDCRLKSVEQMQLNSSTPSSSVSTDDGSAGKSRRKVPAKVAVRIYNY